jgi:hypothetical protein
MRQTTTDVSAEPTEETGQFIFDDVNGLVFPEREGPKNKRKLFFPLIYG